MGTRLLNRTTRSVGLTEAGATLVARLAPALATVEEALADLYSGSDLLSGRIRITTMEHGASVLLERSAGFMRAHPAVEIELLIDTALVDLASAGCDAGIRLGEQVAPDMVALPITPELSMAAMASPSYLRDHGCPDMPRDLVGHSCLRQRLSSGAIYRWEFEDKGRESTVEPVSSFTSNSLAALVTAALQGIGICYVPSHHGTSHLQAGRLVQVLERYSPTFDGLCLYYPPYCHQTRAFAAFTSYLRGDPATGS